MKAKQSTIIKSPKPACSSTLSEINKPSEASTFCNQSTHLQSPRTARKHHFYTTPTAPHRRPPNHPSQPTHTMRHGPPSPPQLHKCTHKSHQNRCHHYCTMNINSPPPNCAHEMNCSRAQRAENHHRHRSILHAANVNVWGPRTVYLCINTYHL